jgi:tetratricopeptide (TPR) repeat protein
MCFVVNHLPSTDALHNRIAGMVLAFLTLLAPIQLRSQCQPAEVAKVESGNTNNSAEKLQFHDEPQFIVAGVADTTNLGGHGSDTVVRTKESLAKDTVSLSKSAPRDQYGSSSRLEALEKAALLKPEDYDAAYELAQAYASAGRYDDVRSHVRALIARQDRAELHHLLGDVEEKAGNPLDAVREYQRAGEMNPSESHLFDWGTELLAHRAVEPAIEVFSKGGRLFPRSVRMLVALGVSWYSRGDYAHSTACLFDASDLNPADPTPYLFMGKILNAEVALSQGFVERLGRFARLQPENAAANYYYATAVWKSRKGLASIPQVESLLNKATLLDPKLGDAHLLLGIVHSDERDFPKAITDYQRAIKADPEREEPHYRLAQLYRHISEKSKAEQELQLYEQLQKKNIEKVERERHEIQQFVFSLRDPAKAGAEPQHP